MLPQGFKSPLSVRRGLVAGAAVLVLGGSAFGIAAAQSTPAPAAGQTAKPGYQAFVDKLASNLGISTTKLTDAITKTRTDLGLPASGGFPGGGGRGGSKGFGANESVAAQTLGITPQQLETELAGKSLAQVATAHGKTAADVATALKNDAHTRIDQAVAAGRLAADQASTQKAQVDQRIDQQVNQVEPASAGEGFGGGRGHGRGGADLTTAAQAIGITPQQLETELPGKSLAQVATAHGKSAADVISALKAAAHTRIDQAVAAGSLTADQATARRTQVDQRIDQQVNQVRPQGGPGAPRTPATTGG